MPTIYETWIDRIDSGTFTKSQCQAWKDTVHSLAYWGNCIKRTNLTIEQATMLCDQLSARGGVELTADHTAQGLAWLRRYGVKVLGMPSDWYDEDNFARFLFTGRMSTGDRRGQDLPVWRIVTKDGRQCDYYNAAWQVGNDQAWWIVEPATTH